MSIFFHQQCVYDDLDILQDNRLSLLCCSLPESSVAESVTSTFPFKAIQAFSIIQFKVIVTFLDICQSCTLLPGTQICPFPIAFLTNHCHLCDLRQNMLVLAQFCRSEVWNRAHWALLRCWLGCAPSRGWGENPFSCLFQLLELHPLANDPFLHLQSLASCFGHHVASFCVKSFLPPSYKDSCNYIQLSNAHNQG